MYEFLNLNNFSSYFNDLGSTNSGSFDFFNAPISWSMPTFNFSSFTPYSNSFNVSNVWSGFSMPSFSSFSFNNLSSNNSWGNCWANIGATSFSWNNIQYGTNSSTTTSSVSRTNCKTAQDYRNRTVEKARSYIGKVNSDAEGNKLFSPSWAKGKWGWCADFATYVAKDIYGDKLPSGFKNSSPHLLVSWAKKHSCFNVPPSSNKGSWIANNVKPGDIMISSGKGVSKRHVAIVSKVNSDGSFETIDGNSGDMVRSVRRKASGTYYGFISLDKFVT